jgi:outer membrane protein assembly factor BamB
MPRQNSSLLILVIITLLIGQLGAAEDWPDWRGIQRNSSSLEKNWNPNSLKSAPKINWKINVQKGYSSLTVKGERIYTMGNNRGQDTVYCLDSKTGKIIWQYSYACSPGAHPGPKATPIIDETQVYTLSARGDLYCFNALNGKVQWSKQLEAEYKARAPLHDFAGSPLIVNDLIILNACTSGIALNKYTGQARWVSKGGVGGYAAPVLFTAGAVRGVAIFGEKALYGVELLTGKVLWSYPWLTSYDVNAADPLVMGDKIFITSGYGTGCALLEFNASTVREIWKNKNIASHFSSPVFFNGLIYGVNGDAGRGSLRALDPATGNIIMDQNLGFGSFIIVNDKIIYLRENGTVTIASASPSSFTILVQAKIGSNTSWTPPSFADGNLYIRNDQGDVVCVDLR